MNQKHAELLEKKKSLNEFLDAKHEVEATVKNWRELVTDQENAHKAVIDNISAEIIEQTD